MCNREICRNSTVDSANSSEEIYESNHEFLSHLCHCKCKVIGLVRHQMERVSQEHRFDLNFRSNPKYQNTKSEVLTNASKERGVQTLTEVKNQNEKKTEARDNETSPSPPLETTFFPSFLLKRPPLPQLNHFYQYKNVVVGSLVMLGVVWMALVLGALLGASVCGDKRTCLPIFQLDSTIRSKHSIF
ncbi:uncharacterized protein [Fopius arisanus]|uniref:Uncharacterized protein n=1 Tax=Fopius arisanus TaxID=64838 RepID=A0A9R1U0I9_9HYME|nr:PREDICTED: uncharacterized protein LOC105266819 [Fopius arisanus]XP_011303554.1 PREDICTED: uncharacterized protein LOC105266819 [Fopius arisanus]